MQLKQKEQTQKESRSIGILFKYLPVLKTWETSYFLTLTSTSCKKEELPNRIDDILYFFWRIKEKYKKRYQRGKGQNIVGLRSLECNFNPKALTYNPHLHIILKHKENVNDLIDEWCKDKTKGVASHGNQVYRRIWDNEGTLIETVKYGSKIFTEPDVRNKKNSKIPPSIYANALDNILTAFEGHKLLQSFGFTLPKQPEKPKAQTQVLIDFDELTYDIFMNDWVNTSTGELFSNYKPSPELSYLLNDINMEKS